MSLSLSTQFSHCRTNSRNNTRSNKIFIHSQLNRLCLHKLIKNDHIVITSHRVTSVSLSTQYSHCRTNRRSKTRRNGEQHLCSGVGFRSDITRPLTPPAAARLTRWTGSRLLTICVVVCCVSHLVVSYCVTSLLFSTLLSSPRSADEADSVANIIMWDYFGIFFSWTMLRNA